MQTRGTVDIKKRRILHITGGMNAGGAETMLMHLYRNIHRDVIQFDFISFTNAKCHYDDEIIQLGGRVFYIDPPSMKNIFKFIRDICRHIRKNGPYCAVHAHTLYNSGLSLFAAWLAGVKLRICHAHTTMDKYNRTLNRKVYFFLMRLFIKLFANKRIACSRAAGEFLFGQRGANEDVFLVLPNAIDIKPFGLIKDMEIEAMKAKLLISRETLVLGHVGNFGSQKNHIFLVELAELMRERHMDFKLLLIGQGDLKEKLETLVSQKHLTDCITFLGVQQNIPLYMNIFDVFVFPSLYEGLGIALIEAQAAGIPCIISDRLPEESDMGLGLIKRVSLEAGIQEWLKNILCVRQNKRIEFNITSEKILQRGYDLEKTTKVLESIYGYAC